MPRADPIAYAIPFFLGAILLEGWVAKRRGVKVYRFFDAIVDLACGLSSQAFGLFSAALVVFLYSRTYEHAALVRFSSSSPWPWILGFVGLDFFYYWWHRYSHEVNFLWAAHIVHHQSEDYNLAVALRQAWFTSLTDVPFYLPLALLGVPTEIFLLSNAVSLLYQFWIHTELIRRIDPFETVLNTPSHHRVHHATNPEYLDKNYGAILIIWDRMFGTFEPERAPCVYGITKPFASTNAIWANFHYWVELARKSREAGGFWQRVRYFFRAPGWNERTGQVELPQHFVPREAFRKYAPLRESRGVRAWVVTNFLLASFGLTLLLFFHFQMNWLAIFLAASAIIAATWGWSVLFERRPWAYAFESVRVMLSLGVVAWLLQGNWAA